MKIQSILIYLYNCFQNLSMIINDENSLEFIDEKIFFYED